MAKLESIDAPSWAPKPQLESIEAPSWAAKNDPGQFEGGTGALDSVLEYGVKRPAEAAANTFMSGVHAAKDLFTRKPTEKSESLGEFVQHPVQSTVKAGKEALENLGSTAAGLASPLTMTVGPLYSAVASPVASAIAEGARGVGKLAGAKNVPSSREAYEHVLPGVELAGAAIGALGPTKAVSALKSLPRTTRFVPSTTEEGIAGRVIEGRATDPLTARYRLEKGEDEIIPGSKPTTYQKTEDPGLGQLERTAQTRRQDLFQPQREEQNAARLRVLEAAQPTGSPQEVSQTLRDSLNAANAAEERNVQIAQQRAWNAAQQVGGNYDPEIYAQVFRRELEQAEQATRGGERALWQQVNPNGTLVAEPRAIQDLERSIYSPARMTETARIGVTPREAEISNVIQNYGQYIPFGELTDLRSVVSAAMREEKLARGTGPSFNRLLQLRQGIEDALTTSVADVQPTGVARGAGAIGARERVQAASAATKERAERFNPMRPITRQEAVGSYKMGEGNVFKNIIRPGPQGYDAASNYLRAVGEQGLPELQDALASTLRRENIINPDTGTITPSKLAGWQKRYQDVLRAISERDGGAFAQTVRDAGSAQESVALSEARRAATADEYASTHLKQLLGAADDEQVERIFGNVLSGTDAVPNMRELMSRLTTPTAQEGARRAVMNFIRNRFVSNAPARAEDNLIRAEQFQKFTRDRNTVAALRQVLTPEQVSTLQEVARDIRRMNRSVQTKVRGGSNTAQDITNVMQEKERLGQIIGAVGHYTLGRIPYVKHAARPIMDVLSGLRQGGKNLRIERIEDLVNRAMADPQLAAELLSKTTVAKPYPIKTLGAYELGAHTAQGQQQTSRAEGGGVPAAGGTRGRSQGERAPAAARPSRQGSGKAVRDGRKTGDQEADQMMWQNPKTAFPGSNTFESITGFDRSRQLQGFPAEPPLDAPKPFPVPAPPEYGAPPMPYAGGGKVKNLENFREVEEGHYDPDSPGSTFGRGYESVKGEILKPDRDPDKNFAIKYQHLPSWEGALVERANGGDVPQIKPGTREHWAALQGSSVSGGPAVAKAKPISGASRYDIQKMLRDAGASMAGWGADVDSRQDGGGITGNTTLPDFIQETKLNLPRDPSRGFRELEGIKRQRQSQLSYSDDDDDDQVTSYAEGGEVDPEEGAPYQVAMATQRRGVPRLELPEIAKDPQARGGDLPVPAAGRTVTRGHNMPPEELESTFPGPVAAPLPPPTGGMNAPAVPKITGAAPAKVTQIGRMNALRALPYDQAMEQARTQQHLVPLEGGGYEGAPENIKTPEDLARLRAHLDEQARKGVAGRTWYERGQQGVEEIAGPDPALQRLAAREKALFSPKASPETNLGFAIQAHNAYEAGKPLDVAYTGQQARSYKKGREEGELPLGKKTGPYASHLNPQEETPAIPVNDSHHMANFGYTNIAGGASPAMHAFMDAETLLAADRANATALGGHKDWTPGRIQAAAWVEAKAQQLMRDHGWDYERAMADAMNAYIEHYPKYTAFGTHEATPGVGTRHLPGIAQGSEAERREYAADPRSFWRDETGRDLWYRALGMWTRPSIKSTGVYEGPAGLEINPAEVARPLVSFAGPSGDRSVGPADRAMMDAAEAGRAYVDVQNAGAWSKPIFKQKVGASGSLYAYRPDAGPLPIEDVGKLQAVGGKHGLPGVIDYGEGTALTSFGGGPTGRELGRNKALPGEVESVLGVRPDQVKLDTGYIDYQSLWGKKEGTGAATRELKKYLTNKDAPDIITKLDSNKELRASVLAKMDRDAEIAARTNQPIRADVQRARKIIAEEGFNGLFAALKRGVALPALAFLPLVELLKKGEEVNRGE